MTAFAMKSVRVLILVLGGQQIGVFIVLLSFVGATLRMPLFSIYSSTARGAMESCLSSGGGKPYSGLAEPTSNGLVLAGRCQDWPGQIQVRIGFLPYRHPH